MRKLLSRWAKDMLNLFYPNLCVVCAIQLSNQEELICLHCERHLPKSHFARYPDNPIEKIFWGRTNVQSAAAIYFFNKGGGIQKIMHHLKYKHRKDVGIWLGKQLAKELISSTRFLEIDYIVPVPLHPKKEFKRGFNQSLMIANGMEEHYHWKVEDVLEREKNTATQTKKGKYERWLNVGSSFKTKANISLKNKNVLLIDDVITTGATIEACIQALQKAEVKSVSVAAIASA